MNWSILRLVLASFVATLASAQVTIRVESNFVLTPVWITDATGNAVRDLRLEDFEIEENEVSVAPARLGKPGEAPLELAMLLDMSGSVYPRFELERQAASRFLSRTVRPNDSVFIISVANEPKLIQERTSSLKTALQAIERVGPTTQATAFYNSVAKAVSMLRDVERPDARSVIVALSDGEDNRSVGYKQADVLRDLQLTNALFYSINPNGASYSKNIISRRAQEAMESFAQQTGGASFVADSIDELVGFYERIADELQGQYLLGYYSPAKTGAGIFRHIIVKVRGRLDLRVKARQGYYPK